MGESPPQTQHPTRDPTLTLSDSHPHAPTPLHFTQVPENFAPRGQRRLFLGAKSGTSVRADKRLDKNGPPCWLGRGQGERLEPRPRALRALSTFLLDHPTTYPSIHTPLHHALSAQPFSPPRAPPHFLRVPAAARPSPPPRYVVACLPLHSYKYPPSPICFCVPAARPPPPSQYVFAFPLLSYSNLDPYPYPTHNGNRLSICPLSTFSLRLRPPPYLPQKFLRASGACRTPRPETHRKWRSSIC